MRTELRPGEEVVLEKRKHWVVLVKSITGIILVSLIGAVALASASEAGAIIVSLTVVPVVWLAWRILDRKTNLWVVTDRRVIDEWGILSVNAKESPLDKVHNVSYSQGLMGRILGYGALQIQTAA